MIQRIQSIYLLLVAVLNGLLFIFPVGEIVNNDHVLKLFVTGLHEITEGYTIFLNPSFPLLAIVIISIILALVSIFLFKNRALQMRLSLYNGILIIGFSLLSLFYTYQFALTEQGEWEVSIGLLFAITASLFSILAFRAIKRDDDLVKSVDRIR